MSLLVGNMQLFLPLSPYTSGDVNQGSMHQKPDVLTCFLQASEDALTIQRLSEQASQLQAAFSAADVKAAAAEQHANAQQNQLQAAIADRNAAYDHAKVTSQAPHTFLTLCLQ